MRLQRTVTVQKPLDKVFAYLSDFTTTTEWDPGTVKTVRTSGDGTFGTEYLNTSTFAGRQTQLTYVVVDLVPNRHISLRGENKTVIALDDVHPVEPRPVRKVSRPAGHDPHAEAGRKKLRDQTAADVSAGAAHQRQRAGGQAGRNRQDGHGPVLTDRPVTPCGVMSHSRSSAAAMPASASLPSRVKAGFVNGATNLVMPLKVKSAV